MSNKPVVLILEDLSNWQDTVRRLLDPEIYEIVIVNSLPSAKALLHSRIIDAAIVDIRLEEGDVNNTDGMAFLDEMEKYYIDDRTHAVMLSGHGTIPLAVDALTRSSRSVLTYFEKEKLYDERSRFTEAIKLAVQKAQTLRAERVHRVLPDFLVEAIGISNLTSSLVPDVEPLAANKDLGMLLRNLLFDTLPLATAARANMGPLTDTKGSVAYILCWSRKLVRALGVSIGCTGTLESLQRGDHWQEMIPADRISHSSTKYFDGAIFGMPGISFEQFLVTATPASQ